MMDSTALLKQAHKAIQAEEKVKARHLLQQAIREDPQDYRAWLWLASLSASPQASLEYVKRAEMLNPDSDVVTKARRWAEQRAQTETSQEDKVAVTAVTAPTPDTIPTQTWQPTALRAGAVLLVLILLAAGTFFVWNRWANPVAAAPVTIMQASNIVAVAATATDEPLPTATPSATPNRIQPKQLSAANSGARPTWTLTPTPTDTPIPTDTPPPTYVSDSGGSKPAVRPLGVAADERWIDVDLSQQLLVAYEGNAPIFETLISSGTYDHPTVTGQFRIWLKYEAQTMDGSLLGYDYYLENVPYVMYFYNDYALHGTFWHNNFGTPMSHGCVNMETSDAQWVFSWAGVGTVVNVHY